MWRNSFLLVSVSCVFLLVAQACSDPPNENSNGEEARENDTEVFHPTSENIPDRAVLSSSVKNSSGGLEDEAFVQRLSEATPALQLGEDDSIGEIADIAFSSDDRTYLLDASSNEGKAYDRDKGKFVRAFGGAGQQPDQFRAPEAFSFLSGDRIVVIDRSRYLKIFNPRGQTFRLSESVSLGFTPEDVCTLNDTIYVQGAKQGAGTIHAYDDEGQHLRSFGHLYESESSNVSEKLSAGPITCDDQTGVIVTASEYFPVLRGYSPEGDRKWVSLLDDFNQLQIVGAPTEDGRRSLKYMFSEGRYDLMSSLVSTPLPYVIAQTTTLAQDRLRAGKGYVKVSTYLVSTRSGTISRITNHLPPAYTMNENRLATGQRTPRPVLKLFKY
jgi:hypothetical protein